MIFTKDDLGKWRSLCGVIAQGTFKIKGEAAGPVASLFVWGNGLEQKMKDTIALEERLNEVLKENMILRTELNIFRAKKKAKK